MCNVIKHDWTAAQKLAVARIRADGTPRALEPTGRRASGVVQRGDDMGEAWPRSL